MAYIGRIPQVGNYFTLDAITTSSTATYNLLKGGVAYVPETAYHLFVSLNGVIQAPITAYTVSGSTIVFASSLSGTDSIDFITVLGDTLAIGTPSDDTVATASLKANAVTDAKIADVAATKLTGSIADARVPASAVTQHVTGYDDSAIRADISALALREATNETSAAFNLPNSFIDTFATDTLGTKTDVTVNASGYVSSVSSNLPTNVKMYLKSDSSADGATTFSDSSASPHFTNASPSGDMQHDTAQAKIGSSSILTDGTGDYLGFSNTDDLAFGTGDFYIGLWFRPTTFANSQKIITQGGHGSSYDYNGMSWQLLGNKKFEFHSGNNTHPSGGGSWTSTALSDAMTMSTDTWYHLAVGRTGSTWSFWLDGTQVTHAFTTGSATTSIDKGSRDGKIAMASDGSGTRGLNGNWDDLIVIKGTGGETAGSNFTPRTTYLGTVSNATGTAIQNTNTVGSAKTEVSGTMIYKDNAGTATLGTDLKIYFTCNGGTNWTEAASYNAITPVYATGIKQVRLGKTACTSGTDIRYKAVWANQVASSKETQLHGIGINY